MLSYQSLYNRAVSLSSDDDAATLALFKSWINEGIKKAYSVLNAEYYYATHTDATVDGTDEYKLPYNCSKVHSLKITISSQDYYAIEFPGDYNAWLALTGAATSSNETTYPTYYYVKADTYEIYPASSANSYVMTMRYKIAPKDLSSDDSATSTIKTLTNGATTVTSNAAAFTAAMVGRFFKIDADGEWYKIASYTSTTVIELAREYGGTSIAAGTSAYTIGECSLIPEPYKELPLNYCLYRYYLQKENQNLAMTYKNLWEEGLQKLKQTGGNLTTSGIISDGIKILEYNNFPSGLD